MATLAEIKQQLGITALVLKPELDNVGNKTDWLIHTEQNFAVKVHKNLSLQLQENPQMSNLQLRTFDGLYLIDIAPYVDNSAHQSSNVQTSTQTSIYSKPNHKAQNNTEVIVSVIVAGAVAAFLLGYVFWGYYEYGYLGVEFNSILGIFSFIISGGVTYLLLKKKSKIEYPVATNFYDNNSKKAVTNREVKPTKCIDCGREYPIGTKFCLYDGAETTNK